MTEMTTAEHIAIGQDNLSRLRRANISPSTQMYATMVQEAIAHALIAIARTLDGQERPAVPGLPKGYDIQTQQSPEGQRKWRYVVTGPQFSHASRYRWDTSEGALAAGIIHARDQERHRQSEAWTPLPAAAQALSEPIHVTQNGDQA